MAKMKGAIEVNTERCKGCQLCIIACPQKVIALANKVNLHGYPYVEAVNEEACVGCASCGIVCPDGCITVYRKKTRLLPTLLFVADATAISAILLLRRVK